MSAQAPNAALGKAVIATKTRKSEHVRCRRQRGEWPTRIEHSESRSTGLCERRGHVLKDAERPELRHAGPNDVNREAELRASSRVACSDLLGLSGRLQSPTFDNLLLIFIGCEIKRCLFGQWRLADRTTAAVVLINGIALCTIKTFLAIAVSILQPQKIGNDHRGNGDNQTEHHGNKRPIGHRRGNLIAKHLKNRMALDEDKQRRNGRKNQNHRRKMLEC